MKRLTLLFCACTLFGTAFRANADVTVTVDPGKPWIGYMNVSEIPENGGAYLWGSPWGTADLRAWFSGDKLNLAPNSINDPASYWYTPSGGPGSTGNKTMDANFYVEDATLPGEYVIFKGEILSNTLVEPYTAQAFIKEFSADYSTWVSATWDLEPGPFEITLQTSPGTHVQYGFETIGPCVWVTDAESKGTVTLKSESSSGGETIYIDPTTATACGVTGQAWPGLATTPVKNAGGTISYFYSGGWVDIPFTVTNPGTYDVSFDVYTPVADCKAQIDVSLVGSSVHYATDDIAVPNTGDWGAKGTASVTGVPLPQAGNYILRVRNTKMNHNNTAGNREPGYETDTSVEPPAYRETAFNIGTIALARTGDAPAAGTVTGMVKSADMGNLGVAGAYVMANFGTPVPEPGPFWQKGYWTTTGADGSFTLPALAGSNNVQAGLPSMYAFAGSNVFNVTVNAGTSHTADLNLPSRYVQTDGRYSVQVESEYFTGKTPDTFSPEAQSYQTSPVAILGRAVCQNGLMCGYIDIGNYIEIPVDVPVGQAGDYTVSDIVFNGNDDGINYLDALTRFTANAGTTDESVTEMIEPNTTPKDPQSGEYVGLPDLGYTTPATYVFTNAIRLKAGRNIIRIESLDNVQNPGSYASSDWDAFVLTQKVTASARRALRIAAGLETAPSGGDFGSLNTVATGGSATVIDIADAVALAKAGKL